MTETFRIRLGTPRLIVRTLIATFGAILLILATVFVVLTVETRNRAARAVAADLETTERVFAAVEDYRRQQFALKLAHLSSNAELAAALGRLESHPGTAVVDIRRQLASTASELTGATLVATNASGSVVASAGSHESAWSPGRSLVLDTGDADLVVHRPEGVFRVLGAGSPGAPALYVASLVDDRYAEELAGVSGTQAAIVWDRQLIATTLESGPRLALRAAVLAGRLPESGTLALDPEQFIVRRALVAGPLHFYALNSLDRSVHRESRDAFDVLAFVALGALLLGAGVSFWLARSVARPIDALSKQLCDMARARDFSRSLPPTGSSRELDELTTTFNDLISSLASAEQQTEQAYVGAIRALAAALDCRDPYTAGHSERVSALSVMIGRQLGLDAEQLDVLRLGALLHDIGKIGINDTVLTKAGPLSATEFEMIKMHPIIGAHILRQVPFLSAHLPIVELHHERPDGRGYPHALPNHATPLLARIVHVADAFDAMTTARAYRPAGTPSQAIAELWRFAGSQFDTQVVEAFVTAWSALPVGDEPQQVRSEVAIIPMVARSSAVLPFPSRAESAL